MASHVSGAFKPPGFIRGAGDFSDVMSVSMIDVMRGLLRPPDESGGYRMIDGITCVRGFSAPLSHPGGRRFFCCVVCQHDRCDEWASQAP